MLQGAREPPPGTLGASSLCDAISLVARLRCREQGGIEGACEEGRGISKKLVLVWSGQQDFFYLMPYMLPVSVAHPQQEWSGGWMERPAAVGVGFRNQNDGVDETAAAILWYCMEHGW